MGRHTEATPLLEETVAGLRAAYGEDHRDTQDFTQVMEQNIARLADTQ